MKALPLLVIIAASQVATAQGWVNFIRQNQQKTGLVWDMPVLPQGQAPSMLTLEEDGALFQLWTIRQSDAKDFLLDQKLVGAYLPKAEIRIQTLDPYPHVHRTRADQPFSVEVEVWGLLSGAGIPDAASKVLLEQHLASYTNGQTSIDPRIATGGTPSQQGYLSSNQTFTFNFRSSSLPGADLTKVMGEEHFVVHALPDQTMTQTQLSSNYVQVWPVATGSIIGLNNGDVVRLNPPPIQLELNDLYPRSDTYLQIYKGGPVLGTEGQTVDGTVLVLDQDAAENRVISLTDWASAFESDGQYTIELVTVTPFGSERLAQVTFDVKRSLTVRATLGGFTSSGN